MVLHLVEAFEADEPDYEFDPMYAGDLRWFFAHREAEMGQGSTQWEAIEASLAARAKRASIVRADRARLASDLARWRAQNGRESDYRRGSPLLDRETMRLSSASGGSRRADYYPDGLGPLVSKERRVVTRLRVADGAWEHAWGTLEIAYDDPHGGVDDHGKGLDTMTLAKRGVSAELIELVVRLHALETGAGRAQARKALLKAPMTRLTALIRRAQREWLFRAQRAYATWGASERLDVAAE